MLPRPKPSHHQHRARLIGKSPRQARPVIITIESDTLPRLWLLAGLDKTQHSSNDKWSCSIPPKENRLKVRIEAGEGNFQDNEH